MNNDTLMPCQTRPHKAQNRARTTLCIYCKKILLTRTQPKIPREHVIPKMLGLFGKDTMTLNDSVCLECNNYFSKLELAVGRDSVFGVLFRAILGLLSEDKFSVVANTRRKKLVLSTYSPTHGNALVDLELDNKALFRAKLSEQFILYNSTRGICVHYPSNELPHENLLASIGLTTSSIEFLGPSSCLEDFPKKSNEIRQQLLVSGYKLKLHSPITNPLAPLPNDSKLMFSSIIDDVIIRVIAKIGFNYFAYNFNQIALSEHTDAIRNYIRYGKKAKHTLVRVAYRPINSNVLNLKKEKYAHHTIHIRQQGNQIIARVILFNHNLFDVTISNNYPLLLPAYFNIAHRFNILEKKVEPLTA